MLKKILVAVLSAQLIIVPAQAETEKKPIQCTKGFIGVDDVVVFIFVFSIITGVLSAYGKRMKQQPEQPAPDCKL